MILVEYERFVVGTVMILEELYPKPKSILANPKLLRLTVCYLSIKLVQMAKRFILFILLNFGALAIGSLFTSDGVASDWYQELNKAPWTPPGWVFGAAWTTIMLCFSAYLAFLWPSLKRKSLFLIIYALQWVLNVSWNPVFFHLQQVSLGLALINMLTVVVGLFLFNYRKLLGWKSALVLPYFLWLIIATSLNAYIFLYN